MVLSIFSKGEKSCCLKYDEAVEADSVSLMIFMDLYIYIYDFEDVYSIYIYNLYIYIYFYIYIAIIYTGGLASRIETTWTVDPLTVKFSNSHSP